MPKNESTDAPGMEALLANDETDPSMLTPDARARYAVLALPDASQSRQSSRGGARHTAERRRTQAPRRTLMGLATLALGLPPLAMLLAALVGLGLAVSGLWQIIHSLIALQLDRIGAEIPSLDVAARLLVMSGSYAVALLALLLIAQGMRQRGSARVWLLLFGLLAAAPALVLFLSGAELVLAAVAPSLAVGSLHQALVATVLAHTIILAVVLSHGDTLEWLGDMLESWLAAVARAVTRRERRAWRREETNPVLPLVRFSTGPMPAIARATEPDAVARDEPLASEPPLRPPVLDEEPAEAVTGEPIGGSAPNTQLSATSETTSALPLS